MAQKRYKTIGKRNVSAFRGVGAPAKKRGPSYGYPETFKNVAQTICFRNKSFSRQPVGGTVLPRGALDLLWERWETLENQWFPAAHAGQDQGSEIF